MASVVSLLTFALLYSFGPLLAFAALGFLLAAGIGLPLPGREVGARARAEAVGVEGELNARIVDGVQGAQDLLAFGGERDHELPSPG